MINKRKIGSGKEELAAKFLSELGYTILEKNYYSRAGEIDIIAKDGDYLCFVEVKYRKSTANGFPEEAVDYRKISKISTCAMFYMNQKKFPQDTPCRFDVVSILGDEIIHIKNAFDALL